MIKSVIIVVLCFAVYQSTAFADGPAIAGHFPADFKERAFEHIDELAKFGPRSPGAVGEERAFRYIRRQFEKTGLEVKTERFDYETFAIERIDLTVCGETIEAETIGFNPYSGQYSYGGKALFVGPDAAGTEQNQQDLNDRIVITTTPVNYFSLIFQNPRIVVYVNNSDFTSLADNNCSSCSLSVKGTFETRSSANIIAELASNTLNTDHVILSAHWDSYRDSPGADDNGSGVGVLLELARFFSTFDGELGGTIKFVCFGVEELGLVGSRAYLDTHEEDLQNCTLVFNLDQVGGPNGPAVEMLGGVQNIPKRKGETQFPAQIRDRALEGPNYRWRMLDPELIKTFMVSNRPEWLVEAIESSAEQLGFEIRPNGNFGADQQTFTQAGIVATGIGTSGNQHHSPADVPAQINKDNLEIVGKIAANVVLMSLRHVETKSEEK